VRPKFSRWRIFDKPLHCFLGVCCQGSIVSKEHGTHKNSFDFGLAAEASYVEEFTVCGRVGNGTRGERRFQRLSWLRQSPVSRRS